MPAAGGCRTFTVRKLSNFNALLTLASLTKSHGWTCYNSLLYLTDNWHKLPGPVLGLFREGGVEQAVFQMAGCFQVAGKEPSPSARFTPCLPLAAGRKCCWKSPSLSQWGQGFLADWWACSHSSIGSYSAQYTLARRASWAEVRVTLSRNWGW